MEEEIEKCLLYIKNYCKQMNNNCNACDINLYCDKYFTTFPDTWKLDLIEDNTKLNLEAMLKDLAKRYDIYKEVNNDKTK